MHRLAQGVPTHRNSCREARNRLPCDGEARHDPAVPEILVFRQSLVAPTATDRHSASGTDLSNDSTEGLPASDYFHCPVWASHNVCACIRGSLIRTHSGISAGSGTTSMAEVPTRHIERCRRHTLRANSIPRGGSALSCNALVRCPAHPRGCYCPPHVARGTMRESGPNPQGRLPPFCQRKCPQITRSETVTYSKSSATAA